MSQKPKKPTAVCTNCGVYTFHAELINRQCHEVYEGNRCEGVYGSAWSVDDWKECPTCLNTGKRGSADCDACQGTGWIYVREEFWNPLADGND